MVRLIILMCIALLMSSCTAVKAVHAMNKSTDQFIVLEQDVRVLYENGAEKHAQSLVNKLDIAIQTVEQKQYRKFTKPVKVHVSNTIESFTDYCVNQHAAGCVLNERLFLSPKNFISNHDVLIHELSHLHIEQQLGMISWHSGYPSWFKEGLATYVSNGQGASKVTEEEARKAIIRGSTFKPETSGSLIFQKTAYSYGLKSHMFYRQASMLVKYLHDLNELKFKGFILSIADGRDFEKAFYAAYGVSLSDMWEKFIQKQRAIKRNNTNMDATASNTSFSLGVGKRFS